MTVILCTWGREPKITTAPAVMQVLLSAQRGAHQLGGKVRLFGLKAQVHRAFEMSGLDRCFHLGDTRQQAMEDW
jgi:anti-anti-sigma regulatory factor